MLIKRIYFNDFLDEFEKHGRQDSFSYEGKKALFHYLEEILNSIGEPMELDVIALCYTYSEYESLEQFNNDYGYSIDEISSIDDINYYTVVIPIDDKRFIIQDF